MLSPTAIVVELFLVPLAVLIIYYDVRYRRIPNAFVLATLISGLTLNFIMGGLQGGLYSAGGCVLAFILMFMLHVFGAMGARRQIVCRRRFSAWRSTRASDFCGGCFNRRCAGPGFRYALRSFRNHDASCAANSCWVVTRLADAEIQRPC